MKQSEIDIRQEANGWWSFRVTITDTDLPGARKQVYTSKYEFALKRSCIAAARMFAQGKVGKPGRWERI